MARISKFGGIFFIVYLCFCSALLGQTQQTSQPQNDLGGTYFVDEAGIELATTASPLDEFIDATKYILGPYDILSVYGKGLVEFNFRGLAVNASGDITIPAVGSLSVKGLTVEEAKKTIQSAIDKNFKNAEVFVTIDRPRPVTVNIAGQIQNPGKYRFAAGTRFDAVVSSIIYPPIIKEESTPIQIQSNRISFTGINFDKIASQENEANEFSESLISQANSDYDLRHIKVTNTIGETTYIDLSAYFNSGQRLYNPYLSDGDEILLLKNTKTQAKISISGAVNNEFTGSYRTDDTLKKLLDIAGGLSLEADSSYIIIFRTHSGITEKLKFFPNDQITLEPNDRIIIPTKVNNVPVGTASVEGQVIMPGIFSIIEGQTTVNNLLEFAGGLTDEALPHAAYLIRKSFDNRGVNSVTAINPSLLNRTSDQYLEGFDYLELERALTPNRMALDLSDTTFLRNTYVSDGDQLFIPKNEHTITLMGQVNRPGFYQFNPEKSATNYIAEAGGTTIAANKNRVFIIKAGSRAWYKTTEAGIESGDIIFVDRVPFEDVSTSRNYLLQLHSLKNSRTSLILAAISTVATVVTTYVAVTR